MSYDSDASFDDTAPDTAAAFTSPDTPDTSSAAVAGEAAIAMAAASMQDDARSGMASDGWDPPPPPMHTMMPSRAVAPGTGWDGPDDADSDWDDRGGSGRRRGPTTVSAKGQVLRDVALRAYTLHPDACHQSTAEVAHHFGHRELDGQSATAQVATLRARWREVNGGQAGALAERGVLAIAALAGQGNASHTAVVVAGPTTVVDNKVYPAVCGGGLPMRRSDGTRTAAETWSARERANVRYFTPDTRSWLRRAFAALFF